METYLREWTTEPYSTTLSIVEFKNKEELLKEKKQLEKSHSTISLRYFKLNEVKIDDN